MKQMLKVYFTIGLLLLLVACGSEVEPSLSADSAEASVTTVERVRLDQSHTDASDIQTQLAVGTLQLEDSELAIDEALASELLPLWEAYQALSANDTTADAELTAILNQIQDTMQPEQIRFITDLAITGDSVQALIEAGDLALGGPGGRGAGGPGGAAGNNADAAAAGGGGPGGGGPGGGGRGQGGGVLGGGPGGGGAGGGGADFANLSEEERAELRAERFGEGGDFIGQAAARAVTNLLTVKTGGEVVGRNGGGGPGGNGQQLILEAVATALSMEPEQLRTQLDEGESFASIIEASGNDIDTLRADLESALAESPLAANGNLAQTLDRILSGE